MGNGQANTLEADAWDTIDAAQISAPVSTRDMILSYTDTQTGRPANLPLGYFALESNVTPNAFHVFKWDTLSFA